MNHPATTAREPLPLIVGITGHRDICADALPTLEQAIAGFLRDFRARYAHCPVVVLSSLADGADRLCARAALLAGCELIVPLPMPAQQYRLDFDDASQREFDALLSDAANVFVVDAPDAARGACYRAAGHYVARQSHLLLALWDGEPYLSAEGGGTYETIQFARQAACAVCVVPTPRDTKPSVTAAAHIDVPTDTHWAWIDTYNRDLARHSAAIARHAAQTAPSYIGENEPRNLPGGTEMLLWTSLRADALSVRFRNASLWVLRTLSTLGLLLVLSFLLYDELESDAPLILYALLLAAAAAVYGMSVKRALHAKYVRYRTLAEALRVQFYWRAGGIGANVWDHYTFTQQSELAFVRCFLRAVDGGMPQPAQTDAPAFDLCRCWVDGQRQYHAASQRRKTAQNRVNQRATRCLFALSIVLFVLIAAGEAFYKPALETALPLTGLRRFLLAHTGQVVMWRGIAKIALGIVSASTAFLANYYGNLALPRQILDNQRMHALFAAASFDQPDIAAQQDTLLLLGRESLMESAGWYIAQRELAPGLMLG